MLKITRLFTLTALSSIYTAAAAQQPIQQKFSGNLNNYQDPCLEFENTSKINDYINCLTKYADEGGVWPALLLHDIYSEMPGVQPDQVRATFYASLAAEKNDPIGLKLLAERKAIGRGTQKNWEEALALRRKQAAIQGELGPYHIFGIFTGHGIKEDSIVSVELEVLSNSTNKSCKANGGSVEMNNMTCEVMMKYFVFLPAVNSQLKEVDGIYTTTVRFAKYRKPDELDYTMPARLIGNGISSSDLKAKKVSWSGKLELTLSLRLSETGAVVRCNSSLVAKLIERAACEVATRKLKFLPEKNAKGRNIASSYPFLVSLDSGDSESVSPVLKQSAGSPSVSGSQTLPPPINQNSSEDKILSDALNRCQAIGFEKASEQFKNCVMEQIKIISNSITK